MCIARLWFGGGEEGRKGITDQRERERERERRTFNRIRLCQLAAVLQQFLRQSVPRPLLLPPGRVGVQAQVYVRGGEVVGVELVVSMGFRFRRLLARQFFCFSCAFAFLGVDGGRKGREERTLDNGTLVRSMESERLGGFRESPDIAVPAVLDQFFVWLCRVRF